jgi:hypothetical protein
MFIGETSGDDAETNRRDYALPTRHFGRQTAARSGARHSFGVRKLGFGGPTLRY